MPGPDSMFLGFGCFFAVVAVLILIPMLMHTALFGTVFYTIFKQVRRQSQLMEPHPCSHCGTARTGRQPTCPNCGAPFDPGPSPTV
jgi:hypothetical protein